jgi:hypothetical protein
MPGAGCTAVVEWRVVEGEADATCEAAELGSYTNPHACSSKRHGAAIPA